MSINESSKPLPVSLTNCCSLCRWLRFSIWITFLIRRKENDSYELEHGSHELDDNSGEERPESIQDGGVVDLQQRSTRSQGGEQIEAEPGGARTF